MTNDERLARAFHALCDTALTCRQSAPQWNALPLGIRDAMCLAMNQIQRPILLAAARQAARYLTRKDTTGRALRILIEKGDTENLAQLLYPALLPDPESEDPNA